MAIVDFRGDFLLFLISVCLLTDIILLLLSHGHQGLHASVLIDEIVGVERNLVIRQSLFPRR